VRVLVLVLALVLAGSKYGGHEQSWPKEPSISLIKGFHCKWILSCFFFDLKMFCG